MKILVLIPARGGSKRLPGKNIKLLGNKPLINWSIDLAKNLTHVCDVLVSTDDQKIAEVAKSAGALVPWLRPTELSSDTATSLDVCLHAIDWYEKNNGPIDALLLLQPTSPFRNVNTMTKGIEDFIKNKKSVVGVSPAESHPFWCYKLEAGHLKSFIDQKENNIRSQDLPSAYVVNGSFYLISPLELKTNKAFIGPETMALVMEKDEEKIDIDTQEDWDRAALCELKLNSKK